MTSIVIAVMGPVVEKLSKILPLAKIFQNVESAGRSTIAVEIAKKLWYVETWKGIISIFILLRHLRDCFRSLFLLEAFQFSSSKDICGQANFW